MDSTKAKKLLKILKVFHDTKSGFVTIHTFLHYLIKFETNANGDISKIIFAWNYKDYVLELTPEEFLTIFDSSGNTASTAQLIEGLKYLEGLKAVFPMQGGRILSPYPRIDDANAAKNTVWSGEKVQQEFTANAKANTEGKQFTEAQIKALADKLREIKEEFDRKNAEKLIDDNQTLATATWSSLKIRGDIALLEEKLAGSITTNKQEIDARVVLLQEQIVALQNKPDPVIPPQISEIDDAGTASTKTWSSSKVSDTVEKIKENLAALQRQLSEGAGKSEIKDGEPDAKSTWSSSKVSATINAGRKIDQEDVKKLEKRIDELPKTEIDDESKAKNKTWSAENLTFRFEVLDQAQKNVETNAQKISVLTTTKTEIDDEQANEERTWSGKKIDEKLKGITSEIQKQLAQSQNKEIIVDSNATNVTTWSSSKIDKEIEDVKRQVAQNTAEANQSSQSIATNQALIKANTEDLAKRKENEKLFQDRYNEIVKQFSDTQKELSEVRNKTDIDDGAPVKNKTWSSHNINEKLTEITKESSEALERSAKENADAIATSSKTQTDIIAATSKAQADAIADTAKRLLQANAENTRADEERARALQKQIDNFPKLDDYRTDIITLWSSSKIDDETRAIKSRLQIVESDLPLKAVIDDDQFHMDSATWSTAKILKEVGNTTGKIQTSVTNLTRELATVKQNMPAGGATATGRAGGDLTGTYPNPTLKVFETLVAKRYQTPVITIDKNGRVVVAEDADYLREGGITEHYMLQTKPATSAILSNERPLIIPEVSRTKPVDNYFTFLDFVTLKDAIGVLRIYPYKKAIPVKNKVTGKETTEKRRDSYAKVPPRGCRHGVLLVENLYFGDLTYWTRGRMKINPTLSLKEPDESNMIFGYFHSELVNGDPLEMRPFESPSTGVFFEGSATQPVSLRPRIVLDGRDIAEFRPVDTSKINFKDWFILKIYFQITPEKMLVTMGISQKGVSDEQTRDVPDSFNVRDLNFGIIVDRRNFTDDSPDERPRSFTQEVYVDLDFWVCFYNTRHNYPMFS